ncbi:MAG: SCO family protein [Sulfuritalea sp.]|nr:SCO family protein [Sulfuritalea sp.]
MRQLPAWALCLCLILALPAFAESSLRTPKHSDEAVETDQLMPRYLLQDHLGRAVMHSDFRGRLQLVTFGFTSCPDVCPTTLLAFKNILEGLGEHADQLQAIFISVDPERDTASLLHAYTSAFDSRILGLRGSPELLQRAAQSFKVRYEKVREPGAPEDVYTMNHSAGMYLLGSDGRFLVKFATNAAPGEVAARILKLIAADHSLSTKDRR